jgi:hypothetical protein
MRSRMVINFIPKKDLGKKNMNKMQRRNTYGSVVSVSFCDKTSLHHPTIDTWHSKLKQQFKKVPRTYFACVRKKNVEIYDTNIEHPIHIISQYEAQAISFLSDHKIVIATKTTLAIWNMHAEKFTKTISLTKNKTLLTLVVVGKNVVLNSGHPDIVVWDTEKNEIVTTTEQSSTYDMQPFNDKLVNCQNNEILSLWDFDPPRLCKSISVNYYNVFSADKWTDNQIVVAIQNSIKFFNIESMLQLEQSLSPTEVQELDGVSKIGFLRKIDSNKIALLLARYGDYVISIWNPVLKKMVKDEIGAGSNSSYRPFVISKNLLLYYDDMNVKVFNTDLMEHVRTIEGPFNSSVCIATW